MPSLICKFPFNFINCVVVLCLLLPGLARSVSAQSIPEIDSIHVFHFEKKSFRSYPLERDVISPDGVIGESKYGTLNNVILGDFDRSLRPDTTILHRVSDFHDPSDYPFSSAVKLHVHRGDTLAHRCTGIMISDHWIATANHCIEIRRTHHNNWSTDSISTILASPSFHNGAAHPAIGTVEIDKAIFLAGSFFYPDIVFLRLPQPAGRLSGTVAMRSSATEDIDETHTSLTFGYPARYFNHELRPDEYDNIYNGDTLYFSLNAVSSVSNIRISIQGHSNPGQSGSPILFFRHGEWSSYGVMAHGVMAHTSYISTFFSHLDAKLSHNIQELMIKYDQKSTAGFEEAHTINSIHLKQNYPNPFNPSTRIVYEIPYPSHVRLEIYDLLGRRMATLTDEMQGAGRYEVTFDASTFSSGVYLYRLQAGGAKQTKKMTLIQ